MTVHTIQTVKAEIVSISLQFLTVKAMILRPTRADESETEIGYQNWEVRF